MAWNRLGLPIWSTSTSVQPHLGISKYPSGDGFFLLTFSCLKERHRISVMPIQERFSQGKHHL